MVDAFGFEQILRNRKRTRIILWFNLVFVEPFQMIKNISIKVLLIFMIFFMSMLMAAIGYEGLSGMSDTGHHLKTVYEDRLIPSQQIAQINDLMRANIIQLNLAAMHDPRMEESVLHDHLITLHTQQVQNNLQTITDTWKAYRATFLTEKEQQLAAEYEKRRENFVNEGLQPAIALYEQGQFKEANMHMIKVANPAFNQAKETAEALLQLQMDVGREEYAEAMTDYQFSRTLAIGVIILGVILAAALGYFMIRAIVNPLNQAIDHFHHIANGDLSHDVVVVSNNETGRVLAGLKDMQDKIRSLIRQVKEAVDTINNAAREIAAGNLDLSQRTEEQAASLEQTAASLEQLASTVQQNAGNTHQANQLAQSVSQVAVSGGRKVSEFMEIMEMITKSSRQIADITSVIDSIAFQTNILALNAAVEAARAGEQGRGFVVVADEVRTLAQKSATAAKEIRTLIERSVETVESGSERVKETGSTMNGLVSSIKEVTTIIGEIATATDEQSRGIKQVNIAVIQMDQTTQQNASLVEEAAAAAKSLEEQAAQLVETIGVFRLNTATGY